MRMPEKCTLGLALLMLITATPAEARKHGLPMVLSLRTTDGSRLTALLEPNDQRAVKLPGGAVVPWKQIEKVGLADDREQFEITLHGGEVARGRVATKHVRVVTVVGRLAVPWTRIAELAVEPDGDVPTSIRHAPVLRSSIRFEVTLRDGSQVLGTPDAGTARVDTEFGKIEVPWARVREVSFHEDHETSTLTLWNGDALVGRVDWRALTISTGLGPGRVSAVHTHRIAVSLGGVDLVAKPYDSATGNRHFLNDIRNTGAKRIMGRPRPGPHFLCAHASGRIEYTFERPVREFHAFAAMYHSYCATKGNVIFMVETDDGVVYTSRPIRNAQHEEVYVEFPPTTKLTLITDQNGSPDEDWSVWLHPEAR